MNLNNTMVLFETRGSQNHHVLGTRSGVSFWVFFAGRSWAAFGAHLGSLRPLLGRSWALLGRSWALSGRSWALLGALGALLGGLGVLLGALGALLGRSWASLGCLWGALGPLLGALGTQWRSIKLPGSIFDNMLPSWGWFLINFILFLSTLKHN